MEIAKKLKSAVVALKQVFNSADESKITMRQIMETFSSTYSAELGSDLGEITFFVCLKTLSESLGKMPCYLMDEEKRRIQNHDTMWYLRVKPNEYMTPSQFFTYLEFSRNYYGNGYVYIKRNEGKIEGLYPLDARRMQILVDNREELPARKYYYFYSDSRTGKSYYFEPEEILHFKSWLTDDSGLAGKSVREILATSFGGSKASTKFLNELYSKGLVASAVIRFTGDLKRESQNRLLDEIISQAEDKSRRMITLPIGFDIEKLDMKLTDSQFFELKKYTSLQIAAAFGIEPIHLNDYEKSSYANSSMQNLQFYVNTLLYILTSYEQEMNQKLLTREELKAGMGYKFNVSVLLRGDPQQQADVVQKMLSCGVYSVNEARHLLDRENCEGGEVRFVNGSYVKLQDIGKAYERRRANADNQK